jgi:hypothetical protein
MQVVQAVQARHYSRDRNTKLSEKIATSPNAKLIMPSRFPISNQRAHMLTVGSSIDITKTMLLNEITRADMIQDKALTYWYETNVPELPPFPKPVMQIPPETLAHILGLTSDDEASSTSDSTTASPMYSPTSYSSDLST